MVQKGLAVGSIFLMVFSILSTMTVGYHTTLSYRETYRVDMPFSCYGEQDASLVTYYEKCSFETHPNDAIASDISVISNKGSQDISRSPPMDSPWPMHCHDNRHTGRSPYGKLGCKPVVKWQILMEGRTVSSPAIDENGAIYIGANGIDDCFFAIYPNGTRKWHYDAGDWVMSSPAINDDGTIYFGCLDGGLYALYSNGTKKWRTGIGYGWVFSSPAIDKNEIIYAASVNGHNLYAIYSNGTIKWDFLTDYRIYSSPAVDDNGVIYIGSHDYHLYAIYPNGTKKWDFGTNGEIKSSPTIGDDGTIYFCSWDNSLYAVNPNGTLKWSISTHAPAETSPTIALDGTIYVGSYNGKIFAIRPNGTKKWEYETGDSVLSSPAIDKYGTIYVGSWDGYLYALNPDGTLKWRFLAGDYIESSPAIDENGTIYIAGQFDNKNYYSYSYLYALDVEGFCADAGGPYFGLVEDEIAFASEVSGGVPPYTWHWDFGDDNTSDEQNPNHVYTSPNEYTVILTVTDSEENVSNDTTWATITAQTELGIAIYKNDRNRIISIAFVNSGDFIAFNVSWNIDFNGGFFLIGRNLFSYYEMNLDPDQKIVISIEPERYGIPENKRWVLGLGRPTMTITAEADNAEKVTMKVDTFLFLIFLFEI